MIFSRDAFTLTHASVYFCVFGLVQSVSSAHIRLNEEHLRVVQGPNTSDKTGACATWCRVAPSTWCHLCADEHEACGGCAPCSFPEICQPFNVKTTWDPRQHKMWRRKTRIKGTRDVLLVESGKAVAVTSAILAILLGSLAVMIGYCVFWKEPLKLETLASEAEQTERTGPLTVAEATEIMGVGRTQWLLLVMCGLTFTSDAAEIVFLSFVTQVLRCEWDLTDTEESLIACSAFVGMVVGSPIWGWVADHIGRRPCFLFSSSCITSFGFLTAACPNVICLMLARLMVGVGVGGLPVGFDILAESLPASSRGSFLLYIEFFWAIGSIYITICAKLVLESFGWQLFTALAAVPTLIATTTAYFLLPESPLWLAEEKRYDEAIAIVNSWAKSNGSELKVTELRVAEQSEDEGHSDTYSSTVCKNLVLLMIIWFCFGTSYYGLVLLLPRIFVDTTPDVDQADLDMCELSFDFMDIAYSSAAEVFAVIVAIMLIDRNGRTWTQGMFYAVLMIMLLAMSHLGSLTKVLLILVACVGRFGAMGGSCSTWVHTPELFPTNVRGEAHHLCNLASKVGGFCAPFVIGGFFSTAVSTYIMGLTSFLAAAAAMSLPETAGKLLK